MTSEHAELAKQHTHQFIGTSVVQNILLASSTEFPPLFLRKVKYFDQTLELVQVLILNSFSITGKFKGLNISTFCSPYSFFEPVLSWPHSHSKQLKLHPHEKL